MTLDPVKNFGKVGVSTGYNAAAVTIELSGSHGLRLPNPSVDGAFNMVWWDASTYDDPADDPNREIVRVTAKAGDTLTVTRAQESTTASTKNTNGKTYQMILAPTKKMIDDIQTELNAKLTAASNLSDLSSAATARTNLGLGTMAVQAASSVAITGGTITGITDLAVADGGTGASTAADARTNLGLVIGTNVQAYSAALGQLAALGDPNADRLVFWDDSASSYAYLTAGTGITISGTTISVDLGGSIDLATEVTGILPIANGGTAASTAAAARLSLGVQAKTFVVVGTTSNCDFVCDGTNDGATIQSAIATLTTGGKLFVRNGTYNWDVAADRCTVNVGNFILEGESRGGVIFKATATLHPNPDGSGTHALGRQGIFSVGLSNTTTISNILIKNIVFDCNNQFRTAGLTIWGGTSALAGTVGLRDITLDNVVVKNHGFSSSDNVESGLFFIGGLTTSHGDRGHIDRLTIRDSEVKDGLVQGIGFLGGYFTNVLMEDFWVHDHNKNGIWFFNYDGEYSSSDWTLNRVRFEGNMKVTSASSQANFRDSQQNGINNLTVDHCYFGPTQNPGTTQDYDLTPYWAGNLRITNCLFDRSGGGVSLGASIAGSYAKIFPINRLFFENNIMYQNRTCFDNDSNITAVIRGNIFYEVKEGNIFGAYSRHFPTVIENNLVYDCHTEQDELLEDYRRSVFRFGGDGIVCRNNTIIDDRKLLDPTNQVSLSDIAGGALGARTYYVRYSWANDTGETLAMTETSRAVSANRLLTVQYGSSFIPSGAKKLNIYISTTSGAETLQDYIELPERDLTWEEPTTGLVSGAALPVANTTATKTKFGLYESGGGAPNTFGNHYDGNNFVGIETEIFKDSEYRRVSINNFSDKTYNQTVGDVVNVEKQGYDQGNVSGSVTFDIFNGERIKATLTGNITAATLGAADYVGQQLMITFIQDGTGGRTLAFTGNVRTSGGNSYLSTTAGAVDRYIFEYDIAGYWNEISRSLQDASAFRASYGLVIGTNVQAYDATLTSIASLGTAADKIAYTTGVDTWAETAITSFGRSLIDDADASAARTTLALVIGTNVQAYDADLTTWAGLTPSANAQSLVTAASYAAMRALLDLEAGTDFYSIAAADAAFQPKDTDLTTLAGLTATTDNFIVSVASAWASRTPAQVRTTLGIGSAGLVATDLSDLNEATIEAAIDTLANLVSVQGQTLTLAGAFITSGANSLTLTTTGATNVTLPTTGTLATLAGAETLTNKRVTQRVVSMADATSFTPTGDTADVNTQTNTQAAGTLTANAPSGTPTDGQILILRIKCTNAHTWSWNAIYRSSNDVVLPTSTTGTSKTDYLGFRYNSTDTKWDLVAKSLGY